MLPPSACLEQALAIRRQVLGEGHPDTATSLNNLAALLEYAGGLCRRQAPLRAGPGHPQGDAGRGPPRHRHQPEQPGREPGCPGQARRRRAAAPHRPGDHPAGAGRGPPRHRHQLHQPGLEPGVQGEYADAEPLFRTALAITRQALGEGHPDTARGYANLAANLRCPGQARRRGAAVPHRPGDPPAGTGRGPPRHRHQPDQPGGAAAARWGTTRGHGPRASHEEALGIRRKALPDRAPPRHRPEPEQPGGRGVPRQPGTLLSRSGRAAEALGGGKALPPDHPDMAQA